MNRPKVVVGLPVYNGQKYLGVAIESHLSQSFGDFDLVISDNGSTDATPEICADYASRDKRVKYLRSLENRGILWNHRRVFDAIESPNQYFRWAGADDILEPTLLQAMVEVLDARPEVEAVVPDTKNIDDKGELVGSMARTPDLQSSDVFERARCLAGQLSACDCVGFASCVDTAAHADAARLYWMGSGFSLGTGAPGPDGPGGRTGSAQAISRRFDIACKDSQRNEEVGRTEFQRWHGVPALDLGLRARARFDCLPIHAR
ncbi:MAG: glycosyltransferase [Rhodoferax sp.]|nr:glycosyltransferase [Rhodoferax sp.]